MNSIEHRIRAGLILSLLLTFVALALLADYGVKQISRDFVTTRLQHDTDNLIKALGLSGDGRWQLDPQQVPLIYQRVQSGHYYQVLTEHQQIRSRSLWDRTPSLSRLAAGNSTSSLEVQGEEHWLIWRQGIQIQGQPITLWVAEDIAPFELQWRKFSFILYGSMVVALLLLVLIQRSLLRHSFRQLNALRNSIQQLQQGEIATLSTRVPIEIKPLTEEINHLLQRLEQRIARSRTAMGNLAHELKRVLQRLHLLRDALPDTMQSECDQALEQIRQLTERELKRARIAGSSHPGRRFLPAQDLPHVVEMLRRIYPEVTVDMQLAPLGELPFDRDDMLELIGNLADNACKYARSNACMALRADKDTFTIDISDDGPGIPETMKDDLLDRGIRIDESVVGHGLGLSICKMIVDSYSGDISLNAGGDEEMKGLKVRVHLPLRFHTAAQSVTPSKAQKHVVQPGNYP